MIKLTNSTFGSNTLAHFWVLKCFLPAILRTGSGHIVSIASVLGLVGCAQMSESIRSTSMVKTNEQPIIARAKLLSSTYTNHYDSN